MARQTLAIFFLLHPDARLAKPANAGYHTSSIAVDKSSINTEVLK
jgi:hypothetical protein